MSNKIDCLLIGHNEMDLETYADLLYNIGKTSPAYRDLKLNFIWHQGKRRTVSDILNLYSSTVKFKMGDVFSTTIAYLATYLFRRGFTFDYMNDYQSEKEELKQKLLEGNILTIGITTTLYTSPAPILEICKFIRQYNQEIKIIIGGPFIFNLYYASNDLQTCNEFLSTSKADFLITSSQGEATLVKVLAALNNGESFADIPNITYWNNGGPKTNGIEPENNDLDENIIDWSLFSPKVGNSVSVRTCLSCNFNCQFCGISGRAGKNLTTSLEQVERELDILQHVGTVKNINFVDGTFNYPPERFKELLKMMIRKKYSFKWNSYFRCQFADEETVRLMEESGCEGVYLGIESASQIVLNNMRKGVTVDQYRQGMGLLKGSKILIHTNLIFGYPGETKDTIQETVNFIKEYEPDFYRIQLWYFDRITPVWKDGGKLGINGSNFMWMHQTMNSIKACDYIEQVLLGGEIKASVWVPGHNFNLHNLYRLIHMGMSIDKVKGLLRGFTEGIKEGILDPDKKEISDSIIHQIRSCVS